MRIATTLALAAIGVVAIVLPSASFARGYEPFNVVTDSGQVFSGIVAREAADALIAG